MDVFFIMHNCRDLVFTMSLIAKGYVIGYNRYDHEKITMTFDIRNDVHVSRTKFRVQGNSMFPTLESGDDVIVVKVPINTLVPGDCVFISNGTKAFVHRFLGRSKKDGNKG